MFYCEFYSIASELHNNMLGTYFDKYYDFSDDKRKNIDTKYNPINLMLDTYDYIEWFKKEDEEFADTIL